MSCSRISRCRDELLSYFEDEKKKNLVGAYAVEARFAGRTSHDSLSFLSLRNAQTTEPTPVWVIMLYYEENVMYYIKYYY